MHAERTPNPDSIKWVVGRSVMQGGATVHFDTPPGVEVSPLAERLFAIDGVVGVFLAANFVTVTKRTEIDWIDLAEPVAAAIRAAVGTPLGSAFEPPVVVDEEVLAARIRRVIDEEVRPAVAMDGGDVVFVGFREGVVEVRFRGSCSGCPRSSATLESGIEARLRELVPEVRGVVAR
ncbi:MAG TPA: NifU family protein [Myxococcota bacterium]|nr:NifU family protein [Myxococcota bacterium]MDP7299561.1 NifU family protein [Myxococcota bacterium]HJO23509.1 NifU family protein [Myxococcota bacterium]